MKILIYGAGPFGSLFAQRLSEAQHEVSILARGKRLEELRAHGVAVREYQTDRVTVMHIPVVESLGVEDDYDLIIVPMRKNQALKILPVLAATRKAKTVLFMMNNAKGSEELVEALGKERVMLGFPLPGGRRDGFVMEMLAVNEDKKWTLPVGEVDGRITNRTRTVAAVLASMRGYEVAIRTDMDDWLKCHVALLIASFVPAAYATGLDVKRFEETPDAILLAVRAQREAFKALRSVGVRMRPAGVIAFLEWTPEPLMAVIWKKALRAEAYQVALDHLSEAEDEMRLLYSEFMETIKTAKVSTPNLNTLGKYFDPDPPLISRGSQNLLPDWTGVRRLLAGCLTIGTAVYFWRKKK